MGVEIETEIAPGIRHDLNDCAPRVGFILTWNRMASDMGI